jgi:hypothetical protein
MLVGDAAKARKKLGWKAKSSINDIVHIMVNEELNKIKQNYIKVVPAYEEEFQNIRSWS